MMRRRVAVVATLVALALPGVAAEPARAQADEFGGYTATAAAQGVSVKWVIPALLPVDEPLDASLALSEANVNAGGTAFARSSSVYPGPLLANLGPLLSTGAGVEQGDNIPPYPLMVEAREFDGEVQHDAYPLAAMRASGAPDEASARTAGADLEVPEMLEVASGRSRAAATVGAVVGSRADVVLSGISIGGVVEIDKLVARSAASSDGEDGAEEGDVRIYGATVNGTPVRIGPEGVEPVGGGDDNDPLVALSDADLELRLLSGEGRVDGASGGRASSGLLVIKRLPSFDLSALAPVGVPLLRALRDATGGQPPQLHDNLSVPYFVPESQLVFALGATRAEATTTPGFSFDLDFVDVDLGLGGLDGSVAGGPRQAEGVPASFAAPGALVGGKRLPLPGAGGSGSSSGTPVAPAFERTGGNGDYRFSGLSRGLVLGLVAVAVFAARYVRRYLLVLIGGR